MIKRIDHIDIAVKDIEEGIKLFQKMGFKLLRRTTHGGAAELKLPGAYQPIFELFPVLPEYIYGKPGVRHVAFSVNNAQETYDELKGKGIKSCQDKPEFIPESGRTIFNSEDPVLGMFFIQFMDKERKPPITR